MSLKITLAGKLFKFHKMDLEYVLLSMYRTFLLVNLLLGPSVVAAHSWEKPGCHKVGLQRTVRIPGCLEFNLTTNACRGYCTSFAIPSPPETMENNPQYIITSRADCCSIEETHDVKVFVRCVGGAKEVVFKSASTCSCSLCRRG